MRDTFLYILAALGLWKSIEMLFWSIKRMIKILKAIYENKESEKMFKGY